MQRYDVVLFPTGHILIPDDVKRVKKVREAITDRADMDDRDDVLGMVDSLFHLKDIISADKEDDTKTTEDAKKSRKRSKKFLPSHVHCTYSSGEYVEN